MCGWSESAIVQGDNIWGRVEQKKIVKSSDLVMNETEIHIFSIKLTF